MKTNPSFISAACATAYLAFGLGLSLCGAGANASDLVYYPGNPSFGGNPGNGPGLLASASATKKHTETSPKGGSLLNQTPLEQFNQTLERNVISQLSSAASSKVVGPDGKLTPGTLSTANFTISIVDLGGGALRVTTTDKVTLSSTTFTVQQ
jgi:curli production assembly/transport component CsgF